MSILGAVAVWYLLSALRSFARGVKYFKGAAMAITGEAASYFLAEQCWGRKELKGLPVAMSV